MAASEPILPNALATLARTSALESFSAISNPEMAASEPISLKALTALQRT